MNKKNMMKSIVAIAVLLIGIMTYVLLSDFTGNESVRTLQMLQTYVVKGKIFDADGSLGVSDAYDVHYKYDDKGGIRIVFGNSVMEFTKEQLQDPDILDMLSDINLTFKGDDLYYEGMEVPR